MSDKTDREYRQNMLTILDRFYRGRGGSLLTKDEREALDYAISSIKTDLKYDLLYEETKHIANISKKIEPTTKNDLALEKIVDVLGSYTDLDISYKHKIAEDILNKLSSVTPQEPRWIPVTERLPEENKRVLVWDAWGCEYIGEYIDAEEKWGGKHFINEHGMHSKTVAAWMPLPTPYKAESEDKE